MGEEISKVHFEERDFAEFQQRMATELALLRNWERERRFAYEEPTAGLELEAWLLDAEGRPAPDNGQFLESVSRESVVPELAKFNFELNVQPQLVRGNGLLQMQQELLSTWQACGEIAARLNLRTTCIGTLPTVTREMLCAANMTPRFRFAALNRQVFRMRRGQPLELNIEGIDCLHTQHLDVMLEAAATSLQVHLKIPLERASRYFNAFTIASAATVATAANAVWLFGKRLWHDTRIAVFEQAVDTGHRLRRVSFGEAYASPDFLGLLEATARDYPPLLPVTLSDPPETVPHLRLHNGTVWRWNRPLIGFEPGGAPHVRIEHRVMSAGPTAIDMFANMALAIGLAHSLAGQAPAPESQLPFAAAKSNFYEAARYGLAAQVTWQGRPWVLKELLLEQWLPLAWDGLVDLSVDATLIETAREVLTERVQSGRTAAVWQLDADRRHHGDVFAILADYLACQATKKPVHEW